MKLVFLMAFKDIKVLFRDRMGVFFIVAFPILMGVFFGLVMNTGGGGSGGKMKVAIVDQDRSDISMQFVASLKQNDQLEMESGDIEASQDKVRKGELVGMIVLPTGFGETAGVFWNDPPEIQIGMDPSRTAEGAMLQGFIMQSIGELIGTRLQNPSQIQPMLDQAQADLANDSSLSVMQRALLTSLFGSLDSMMSSIDQLQQQDNGQTQQAMAGVMEFADIKSFDVTREIDPKSMAGQLRKLRSRWDISFPQAMQWGVMACVAGFAVSIARERTSGTLLRLQVAPISKQSILAGKAMACFLTVMGVVLMLTVLGVALGMRPASYPKLALASVCIAFCFVGVMMMMSVLGKTEQSVGGAGWAINMVMAMFGGAMIPAMFLPAVMQPLSALSPVKWSILSVEGAVWREFSWAEMALPYTILIAVGLTGLFIGNLIMRRQDR